MNQGKRKSLETEELLHILNDSKHIDEFFQNHEDEMLDIDLQTYLYKLIEKAGLSISQVSEKACISKSLAYQIFNGQRIPNRNLIIRMAFIMKLSIEDTQRLLKIAKRGELYPRIQRDAAIIFCIQHKYSMIDTNEMLDNLGEALLLKED
ncbi:MAG: helix-turn-helix transcriptional regulator [Mobilitalea sp.]